MKERLFDPTNIIKVKIDNIRPNTWNPKEIDTPEYHRVKESIRQKGLKGFVSVRYNPDDGADYEIIDGQQRWTSAKELGYQEIYVYNEGTVSDQEAKEGTIWWQQQVPFDKVEEAHLVTEMIEMYNNLETLPYSEAEIEEMKVVAEFNFDEYDDKADDEKETAFKLVFTFTDEDEIALANDYFTRADASREEILMELLRKELKDGIN